MKFVSKDIHADAYSNIVAYDPIFEVGGKTYAEMESEEKVNHPSLCHFLHITKERQAMIYTEFTRTEFPIDTRLW